MRVFNVSSDEILFLGNGGSSGPDTDTDKNDSAALPLGSLQLRLRLPETQKYFAKYFRVTGFR